MQRLHRSFTNTLELTATRTSAASYSNDSPFWKNRKRKKLIQQINVQEIFFAVFDSSLFVDCQVPVSTYNLKISPETGLSSQQYKCAECRKQIGLTSEF